MNRPIEEVIDQVRLLFNALVKSGEQLHRTEDVTMGMRAVLEFLLKNGATTVPALARSRRVSRQHIQALMNSLLDLGYVEQVDNPAHRRSSLMQLTKDGVATIRRMRSREAETLKGAASDLSQKELRQVAQALETIRSQIEGNP